MQRQCTANSFAIALTVHVSWKSILLFTSVTSLSNLVLDDFFNLFLVVQLYVCVCKVACDWSNACLLHTRVNLSWMF